MKWSDKEQRGTASHCSCCGRKLKGNVFYVEVIDGGGQVAAPGLNPDQNDPGYMGFHPVGSSCEKKHFKGYTHGPFSHPSSEGSSQLEKENRK